MIYLLDQKFHFLFFIIILQINYFFKYSFKITISVFAYIQKIDIFIIKMYYYVSDFFPAYSYTKSGYLSKFNLSYDNLKDRISYDSNIPKDAILGLYRYNFQNRKYEDYNIWDFFGSAAIYVKVTSLYKQLNNDISQVRNNYSSLQNKYDSLQSLNSKLNNDISNIRNNYSTLQSQYSSLQNLNESNNREIQRLQTQNSNNEQKINNLISSNANLNKELQKEKEIREEKKKILKN